MPKLHDLGVAEAAKAIRTGEINGRSAGRCAAGARGGARRASMPSSRSSRTSPRRGPRGRPEAGGRRIARPAARRAAGAEGQPRHRRHADHRRHAGPGRQPPEAQRRHRAELCSTPAPSCFGKTQPARARLRHHQQQRRASARRAIPTHRTAFPAASSGGTGVAVAARIVPGGIGSDTGGSVRIPAALCGIVGLRPTTGRWSQAGIVPISHTRDTAGPMTRSVADCVLLDGVVTGGPREVAPASLKGLRARRAAPAFLGQSRPRDSARSARARWQRLNDAGVALVDVDMSEEAQLDGEAGFPIALYETVTDLNAYLKEHGCEALITRASSPSARAPTSKASCRACTAQAPFRRTAYRKALAAAAACCRTTYRRHFREHDIAAIVFPTTPAPARQDRRRRDLHAQRRSACRPSSPSSAIPVPAASAAFPASACRPG